jgi:hypothetical protein
MHHRFPPSSPITILEKIFCLGQTFIDGYETMGFDVTQLTQDEEQSLFTIKTNMPIPMLVYGDSFQWEKHGHRILLPSLD